MAYSSVRVQFEIGHEASVRTKKTPEGFTHDWEVFVRGADNTDIQCFVEKVVFHLHETFPKPRRVIKDPPYLVKESGYAGFVLPIDVYLKNKEEPKKISFQYDLQLQPSGPPISRVLREPRLFQNPSEDFRRKLIRGGGVGVDAPSDTQHSDDLKSLPGAIKIKSTDSTIKKHKADTLNTNDSFAELFGTPIRRVLDLKKASEPGKKSTEKEPDFLKNKKKLNKYDTYKEDKEKNTEKERTKERERIKEKQGRRPPSPPSGSASGVQCVKSKEEHKKHDEKKKEEYDEKKRKKEERDRDRRERIKDIKETGKQLQEKDHKKDRKDFKNLDQDKKTHLLKSCEVKGNYEKHDAEFSEKEKHKHRHKKKEKDKNKDREKQKKKEERDEREKEKGFRKRHDENRDRDEKGKRKSKSSSPVPDRLKKKPLNALLDELGSSDSMSPMSDEDANHPFRCGDVSKVGAAATKTARSYVPVTSLNAKSSGTNSNALESNPKTSSKEIEKMGKIMGENDKKDRSSSKKSKKSKEEGQKRKGQQTEERRPRSPSSEAEDDDVERPRVGGKEDRERTEKERLEEEKSKVNKEKDNKKRKRDKSADKGQAKAKKSGNAEDREGSPGAQGPGLLDFAYAAEDVKRSSSSDRFTKEYVAQLKDLQHRIMSLEDNAELQKVVKVIAETGQYEITKKTFDFDLCALDFDTVKRLQDFFLPT